VRIQALTYGQAAEILSVSEKTVQRRLDCSLMLLAKELDHLRPS
jgi:DNA-directed RNA polymerase specialized sigma24 family protein